MTRRTSGRRRATALTLTTATAAAIYGCMVGCSGKVDPAPGSLMLAVNTDMAVPKDIAAVGLYVSQNGVILFGDVREVTVLADGSRGVTFPATIAVVANKDHPNSVVHVRAMAYDANRNTRVLHDAITTVPDDRAALLRLPLLWINEGSGTGKAPSNDRAPTPVKLQDIKLQDVGLDGGDASTDDENFDIATGSSSTCPSGQTYAYGSCATSTVDSTTLPAYQESEVFGGGSADGKGGTCFDVKGCFDDSTALDVDLTTCSATLPSGVTVTTASDGGVVGNVTFGIALPSTAGFGNVVGNGLGLIPMNPDKWQVSGSTVTFPAPVCAKIASGAALGIAYTTACAPKNVTQPLCSGFTTVTTADSPDASMTMGNGPTFGSYTGDGGLDGGDDGGLDATIGDGAVGDAMADGGDDGGGASDASTFMPGFGTPVVAQLDHFDSTSNLRADSTNVYVVSTRVGTGGTNTFESFVQSGLFTLAKPNPSTLSPTDPTLQADIDIVEGTTWSAAYSDSFLTSSDGGVTTAYSYAVTAGVADTSHEILASATPGLPGNPSPPVSGHSYVYAVYDSTIYATLRAASQEWSALTTANGGFSNVADFADTASGGYLAAGGNEMGDTSYSQISICKEPCSKGGLQSFWSDDGNVSGGTFVNAIAHDSTGFVWATSSEGIQRKNFGDPAGTNSTVLVSPSALQAINDTAGSVPYTIAADDHYVYFALGNGDGTYGHILYAVRSDGAASTPTVAFDSTTTGDGSIFSAVTSTPTDLFVNTSAGHLVDICKKTKQGCQ